MLPEQQKQLISLIQAAVAQSLPDAQADTAQANVLLERPKVAAHGDVATNVAMQLAKPAKRNPRELAQAIVEALLALPGARDLVESAEIAGPGFINLRVTAAARQAVITAVAEQGEALAAPPAAARRSWWNSCPPTRPARCTSATPARRPWATPCAACTTPSAGM